jgi:hypothetical protein
MTWVRVWLQCLPFLLGSSELGSGRPGWLGASEEYMVVGLVAQVTRYGGSQISFLLLCC